MPHNRKEGKDKMLEVSPLFSTTYGYGHVWPSQDLIQKKAELDYNDISMEVETNSYDPFLDLHRYDDIQHDLAPENIISNGGFVNGDSGDPLLVVKKLNHNASERERRKRVNDLYGFLRSLLPISSDQKKKVSIPRTVSRALKYIPELQKELEALRRKKENISSCYKSSKTNLRREHVAMKNTSGKNATIETKSSVVSSVSILGVNEVVIQLIFSTDNMSKREEIGLLSDVLEYLEHDENGFVLLNATTFKCTPGEGMSLSTMHLQVQGDNRLDVERLKEKLYFYHQ